MKRKTEKIHISRLTAGDTIIHNGKEMTVCKKDLKRDDFMGTTVFGDSYRIGTILVLKVLFPKWLKNKVLYYC